MTGSPLTTVTVDDTKSKGYWDVEGSPQRSLGTVKDNRPVRERYIRHRKPEIRDDLTVMSGRIKIMGAARALRIYVARSPAYMLLRAVFH